MNKPASTRALLLDLDGTIADTLPHIFQTYRYAVAPWTAAPPTDAEIEATFGPAERDCMAALVPAADLDLALARFYDYYEREHGRHVEVVDGMPGVIDCARSLGWRVGVFTGKGLRSARFTLAELGLWDRLDCLVSGDDVARPKPDAQGVHLASKLLGVPENRILLAGDSPADIQAGRMAGATTVAVLWAAFRPERLEKAGATFMCTRVEELLGLIEQIHGEP